MKKLCIVGGIVWWRYRYRYLNVFLAHRNLYVNFLSFSARVGLLRGTLHRQKVMCTPSFLLAHPLYRLRSDDALWGSYERPLCPRD